MIKQAGTGAPRACDLPFSLPGGSSEHHVSRHAGACDRRLRVGAQLAHAEPEAQPVNARMATAARAAIRAVLLPFEPVARFARRTIARSTVLRVLAVIAGFGAALLPRWLRWLPVALLAIPGPLDEAAFVLFVAAAIAFRPALRRQLRASLRLAIGARYLRAVNECITETA